MHLFQEHTLFMIQVKRRFVRAETTLLITHLRIIILMQFNGLPDKIQFFVDEEMYFEFPIGNLNHSPFDKPFFLLLIILAVGGTLDRRLCSVQGLPEATYEIDYVRVYQ